MSIKEEIDNAIAAHGQWKHKLRKAIDTGESESTPERVKQDNNCAFGKWLHVRIDASAKASAHYPKAVSLHAEFHKIAGHVLDLALKGEKDQASSLISLGSEFSKLSAQLTKELKTWQESL